MCTVYFQTSNALSQGESELLEDRHLTSSRNRSTTIACDGYKKSESIDERSILLHHSYTGEMHCGRERPRSTPGKRHDNHPIPFSKEIGCIWQTEHLFGCKNLFV